MKVALTLNAIVSPQGGQHDDFEEWIALAEGLLRSLGRYNSIAPNAVEFITVMRKRAILSQDGVADNLDLSTPAILERLTKIVAQSSPSLKDLLTQWNTVDPLWTTTCANIYASNFPGFELLCDHASTQTLDSFLDTWSWK